MGILKYTATAYYSFKKQAVFKFNNMMSIISGVLYVTIVYFMWNAVYQGEGLTSALTLQQTITYTVVITIINKLITSNTEMDIGESVNTGLIETELIRPVSFFWNLFFQKIGTMAFHSIFTSLPILMVAILFFRITLLSSFLDCVYFFLSLSISVFLIYVLEFAVGLSSFITTQVFGISLFKQALLGILAGINIPLQFYPEALKTLCINLPFQAIYYIPITIYLGTESEQSFINQLLCSVLNEHAILAMLLEQFLWLVIMGVCTSVLWKIVQKKLTIQGG